MSYMHSHNFVHRDIKPSNVLCECAEDGSVKVVLADFGLASHAMDTHRMSNRCGTAGYVAPEILREDWSTEWLEETITNVTSSRTRRNSSIIF